MPHAKITIRALKAMVFALLSDAWQLRLVPDEDHNDMPVLSPLYSRGELIRSARFLRHVNANGYHVYGRPEAARHVLVDDLCEDALDALADDGLAPAAVVLTSKGNHQAWVTLSKDEIAPEVASAAAKLLARRYGGDPGAASWRQVGRLPGFTNRKTIYSESGKFPWTRMIRTAVPRVASGGQALLNEARELAASATSFSASTRGARDPGLEGTLVSDMTPDEAIAIYQQTLAELSDRFEWSDPVPDRSRADFAVARSLVKLGFGRADTVAVLLQGSEKVKEMQRDRALRYAVRTADRALGLS